MSSVKNRSSQRGGAGVVIVIIVAVLVVLAALVIGGAAFVWSSIESLPPDARPEVVLEQRREFIDQVDGVLRREQTAPAVATALEVGGLPDDLIYLALIDQDHPGTPVDVVKRLDWSGSSYSMVNGVGLGKLDTPTGKVEVIILQRDAPPTDLADQWMAYFRRAEPGLRSEETRTEGPGTEESGSGEPETKESTNEAEESETGESG